MAGAEIWGPLLVGVASSAVSSATAPRPNAFEGSNSPESMLANFSGEANSDLERLKAQTAQGINLPDADIPESHPISGGVLPTTFGSDFKGLGGQSFPGFGSVGKVHPGTNINGMSNYTYGQDANGFPVNGQPPSNGGPGGGGGSRKPDPNDPGSGNTDPNDPGAGAKMGIKRRTLSDPSQDDSQDALGLLQMLGGGGKNGSYGV